MLLFKVFTRAEIALICNLCVAHNVVVIADEVYEHMVSAMNPLQRGAKKISPCLKFPPHFCQAKWPANAQPIGPDGTFVIQLSSLYFARLCMLI